MICNMEKTSFDAQSAGSIERNRRMTACIPCQKQKVRCVMDRERSACGRCLKRDIRCVSKKDISSPSQASLFRAAIFQDLKKLHAAVNVLNVAATQPPLDPLRSILYSENTDELAALESPTTTHSADVLQVDAEMVDESSGYGSRAESLSQAPISSLYHITRLRTLRTKRLPVFSNESDVQTEPVDLISRGVLDLADGVKLTNAYLSKTDYYLYGIASKYKDVNSIRRASSLLFVAICTVSALHDSSSQALYRICNAELRMLISNFVLATKINLDDFRGLCIACFWLSDISWPVSGLAIRRAVEFDLQKCYGTLVGSKSPNNKIPSGQLFGTKADQIECIRLWNLFCICDQHLSILYGRPSIIESEDSLHDWGTYLSIVQKENFQCENTDIRITSQLELLRILKMVKKVFGSDLETRIPTVFKPQLELYIHQLDQWVATWMSKYHQHTKVGDFPSKAVLLHFYFARLFVCSHVFRGLTSNVNIDPIAESFKETAMMAIDSAKSIVDLITHDADITLAFVGLPHYFHTMIAFACSFLLKLTTKYRKQIDMNVQHIFEMIQHVVDLCKRTVTTPHHLIYWMGEGLESLLIACMTATANIENIEQNQQLEDSSRFAEDARINSTPTPSTPMIVQNQEQNPQYNQPGDPQNSMQYLGNVWDTAREAAMLFQGERSVGYEVYSGQEPIYQVNGSGQGKVNTDGMGVQWDASVAFFDVEHMGFELL